MASLRHGARGRQTSFKTPPLIIGAPWLYGF